MITPRRQLRILAIGAGLALTLPLLIDPAYADGGTTAAALGPFDLTDGRGIKISQYQLSIDQGGPLSPLQTIFYLALTITWDAYRFWIALIAYTVDWATRLTWVSWITGPMHAAEQSLRTQVLEPLNLTTISQTGVMGLLLVLAGAAAGVHLFKGHTSRGLIEVLSSSAAAALSVGLLSSPVLLFAGDGTNLATPLRVAQATGVELSNVVTGGGVSGAPLTATPTTTDGDGPGGAGTMITDTFIRPVHQMFNYGLVIEVDNTGCIATYDKTRKAGPYDGGADEARTAVGGCDQELKEYADDTSWTRLIGLGIYGFTAATLGVLVLVFVTLLMMSVLTLTWASLKLLIHAPMAILPGDSRGPGLRDLVDILTSLIFLVAHLVLLSVLIRLIRGALSATSTVPLQVRFVGVDLLILASTAVLVASHINQRRGARSIAQRLRDRLKLTSGKERPSIAAKAGRWLVQPSYGATYGQLSGSAMRRPGSSARRLNRITASNGVQIASLAGRLSAGAATAGAGLALVAATQTSHAAATTVRGIRTGYRVHDGLKQGAQRATTGNERANRLLEHSARAHNLIENRTKQAAARTTTRTVLLGGPHRRSAADEPSPGQFAHQPSRTTTVSHPPAALQASDPIRPPRGPQAAHASSAPGARSGQMAISSSRAWPKLQKPLPSPTAAGTRTKAAPRGPEAPVAPNKDARPSMPAAAPPKPAPRRPRRLRKS